MERVRRENHIFANILSKNGVGVQNCQILGSSPLPVSCRKWSQTVANSSRQTDILSTEIKVITDLFVIVIREIYVHVYTRMLVCENHI